MYKQLTREQRYGIYLGLQEGKTKKAYEVVIKLKEMNLPIEQIAKVVELKEEEVKEILNDKKA